MPTKHESDPPIPIGPERILNSAVKKIPAMRYALAAAGVLAVAAIASLWVKDVRVLIIGAPIIFAMMIAFVLFERVVKESHSLRGPVALLAWSYLILFIMLPTLIGTSVFFSRPLDLSSWLLGPPKGTPSDSTPVIDEGDASIDVPSEGRLSEGSATHGWRLHDKADFDASGGNTFEKHITFSSHIKFSERPIVHLVLSRTDLSNITYKTLLITVDDLSATDCVLRITASPGATNSSFHLEAKWIAIGIGYQQHVKRGADTHVTDGGS